ncbi:universal stress protein [Dyadobacter arcticus]|uniref:Nucleotide-binding universal stress UspA family protein n=1 Tax=Dyadobacter arcticus TaxID=1078754 RepID=A0ABX0UKF9_9BACT|nr:universal stress protein [Dyadobacter arcticus]NIJ52559.1 nucleotide-binding universal stress UspA family protein [Dyadobacter arcticus]
MKKIIAAIDGLKYSESTVQYAVQVARETNSHLVGVFLDDFTHHSYSVYDMVPRLEPWTADIRELNHQDQLLRNQAVENFKELCQQSDTHFTIHHDRNFALPELLHETIYSDLLIIAKNETLALGTQEAPTRFLQDLLGDIQCPVMVVPEEFDTIEKIVMLYDGQPSSLFAIKMFSYLLPFLKELPVEILSVKSSDQNLHIPDNRLMKEFVKRHFQTASYQVLHGNPDQQIAEYLKQTDQNALVVLGAYQRNMVSRWFRKSMADVLMEELKMPLFVAHK